MKQKACCKTTFTRFSLYLKQFFMDLYQNLQVCSTSRSTLVEKFFRLSANLIQLYVPYIIYSNQSLFPQSSMQKFSYFHKLQYSLVSNSISLSQYLIELHSSDPENHKARNQAVLYSRPCYNVNLLVLPRHNYI